VSMLDSMASTVELFDIAPLLLIAGWKGLSASETSVRSKTPLPSALHSTMIVQMLDSVMLVCLGILLGSSWTLQAHSKTLRRLAEERRRFK
jgi:hypothetical protein